MITVYAINRGRCQAAGGAREKIQTISDETQSMVLSILFCVTITMFTEQCASAAIAAVL